MGQIADENEVARLEHLYDVTGDIEFELDGLRADVEGRYHLRLNRLAHHAASKTYYVIDLTQLCNPDRDHICDNEQIMKYDHEEVDRLWFTTPESAHQWFCNFILAHPLI